MGKAQDTEIYDTAHYVKIIGSNMRYERKKRNLTIEELAEMIGMAPGFLGLVERGQRGTSIKNLVKVADIFSISLDQLITIDLRQIEINLKSPAAGRGSRNAKLTTLSSLMKNMNDAELEYLIVNIKALRKLTHTVVRDVEVSEEDA